MNAHAGLAGLAAAGPGMGSGPLQYASPLGIDRMVRQEVSLGLIREIVPPEAHLGLQLWPFLPVKSDDVIFHYALGMVDDLAPARADDAESEMARKDDIFASEGRASVIDWAIKDHYTTSDVGKYREWLRLQEVIRDTGSFPLTVDSVTEDWQAKLARDTLRRRRKLDNRMEWLIMNQVLNYGSVSYDDGKIKFTVDYGRPSNQELVLGTDTTIAGDSTYPLGAVWTSSSSDPIRDIISIQEYAFAVYGVRITRAIASRKVLNSIMNSSKFTARTGLITQSGSTPVDPRYLIDGWGPTAAQAVVEQQTGLKFIEYDAVYRTRAIGSQTAVANRFIPEDAVIFLPEEADIAEFDDTQIGFGRMLTSPHPAGNWQPGFYEWEKDHGQDPWAYDIGNGIKAFPVFPHMNLSFRVEVI